MLVWLCVLASVTSGGVLAAPGHVMVGHPQQVPTNSSRVVSAARFAVSEFNKNNTEGQFKILNITSAQIQVVAGLNYILEVQLGWTVCRSISIKAHSEPCDVTSKKLHCTFVVTEVPWKDSRDLTKKKCHNN